MPTEASWELELGEPFPAPFSKLVAPARLTDGTEVVVKIHVDDDVESVHEPEALRFWDGRGAVRLIGYDAGTRAMVIERCVPGIPLGRNYDDASLAVVARTLRQLWRPPTGTYFGAGSRTWPSNGPSGCASTGSGMDGRTSSSSWTRHSMRSTPSARPSRTSCSATRTCTAGTSLSAEREPWLAIDSEPIVAEPAYDVVPAVRDLDETGRITVSDMRRRLDRLSALLGVERQRVRRWTIAKHLAWATGGQYFPNEVEIVRLGVEVGSRR